VVALTLDQRLDKLDASPPRKAETSPHVLPMSGAGAAQSPTAVVMYFRVWSREREDRPINGCRRFLRVCREKVEATPRSVHDV